MRTRNLGLDTGSWRGSRMIAGVVGVVTTVLTGSAAGLIAAVADGQSSVIGFVAGGVVTLAIVASLMRYQNAALRQLRQRPYFERLRGRCTAGRVARGAILIRTWAVGPDPYQLAVRAARLPGGEFTAAAMACRSFSPELTTHTSDPRSEATAALTRAAASLRSGSLQPDD